MPVLVLEGERSMGGTLSAQAREAATDVRSFVLEGAGHWLMEEAPDQVIPKLLEFLNR
jgi:pimeloyl-ACP methyl ester carboxylesterase